MYLCKIWYSSSDLPLNKVKLLGQRNREYSKNKLRIRPFVIFNVGGTPYFFAFIHIFMLRNLLLISIWFLRHEFMKTQFEIVVWRIFYVHEQKLRHLRRRSMIFLLSVKDQVKKNAASKEPRARAGRHP